MTYHINSTHQPVIDKSWNGVDLMQVSDLDMLVEWWNKLIRYAGAVNTIREKQLAALQNVLWVRINQVHPKQVLRFEDITDRKAIVI